jgi:hypothetical protein
MTNTLAAKPLRTLVINDESQRVARRRERHRSPHSPLLTMRRGRSSGGRALGHGNDSGNKCTLLVTAQVPQPIDKWMYFSGQSLQESYFGPASRPISVLEGIRDPCFSMG